MDRLVVVADRTVAIAFPNFDMPVRDADRLRVGGGEPQSVAAASKCRGAENPALIVACVGAASDAAGRAR